MACRFYVYGVQGIYYIEGPDIYANILSYIAKALFLLFRRLARAVGVGLSTFFQGGFFYGIGQRTMNVIGLGYILATRGLGVFTIRGTIRRLGTLVGYLNGTFFLGLSGLYSRLLLFLRFKVDYRVFLSGHVTGLVRRELVMARGSTIADNSSRRATRRVTLTLI